MTCNAKGDQFKCYVDVFVSKVKSDIFTDFLILYIEVFAGECKRGPRQPFNQTSRLYIMYSGLKQSNFVIKLIIQKFLHCDWMSMLFLGLALSQKW